MILKRIAALSALLAAGGTMIAMSGDMRRRCMNRGDEKADGSGPYRDGTGPRCNRKQNPKNDGCRGNRPGNRSNKGNGRADGSGPYKDGTGPGCNKD